MIPSLVGISHIAPFYSIIVLESVYEEYDVKVDHEHAIDLKRLKSVGVRALT